MRSFAQSYLLQVAGPVVVRRGACCKGFGKALRYRDGTPHPKYAHLASPSMRHSLRRITSCSIYRASGRVLTSRSRKSFSSSPRNFFTSDHIKPPYGCFPAIERSPAQCPSCGTPHRPWCRFLPAEGQRQFCCSVNFDFLHRPSLPPWVQSLAEFCQSKRSNFRRGAHLVLEIALDLHQQRPGSSARL